MNIEKTALDNILNDIDKLVIKRTKKVKELKDKPFCVIVNGEEYHKEHELANDYGGGLITRKQYETGLKAFENHQADQDIQTINTEIDYLTQIWESLNDKKRELNG